ncbi:hypothetical protein KK062_19615 [Fulvivirgaceae bacterium PWU5]|uniref:VWA domain-containing protein n=1 Tax=Dawidia cretensis TaxID=2782350 RepID=A0AAP2E2G4_9BACT|nr:hypothetical protein [Dawidia cretensis]MBT1710462.1 hypothetical protein [Dawidia cretensis]
MQQILFDSSPAYLLLCLVLAAALAYLMYRASHPWSKTWNRILLGLRALLLFLLLFLLLGPIIRQINNLFEKPVFVMLYDDSASVREATDSTVLRNVEQKLQATQQALEEQGYQVVRTGLAGTPLDNVAYTAPTTDLTGALKKVANRYEGKKIAGVLLASDGIYNTGLSPLYAAYGFPVHTLGVGDTLQRMDIAIKNVAYNKIAYQGNQFPVRVEVMARNAGNRPVQVSLQQRGRVLSQQTKSANGDQLLVYDFLAAANDQGIQKLDVEVTVLPGEFNTRNNRASIFVEVVEGKKKILVVAPAPHPDLKALREVIEQNANYEYVLHIPGLDEQPASVLQSDQTDLVIFHQAPDLRGTTRELFLRLLKTKASVFLILGELSDLRLIAQQNMPLKLDGMPREFDDVTPVVNPAFPNFELSASATSLLTDYPPLSVHFGKINVPLQAAPLLYQRIGNLATQKPLLAVSVQDARKTGILLGAGIWRWRLNEFDRTEHTEAFDELFGKLIQFLSTTDDKRKFRSYPLQQEFSDTEAVVFESQVYNDLFEPVYGNTIALSLTDEKGKKYDYSYVLSQGNSQYSIGGLKEGVYRYSARTTVNQKAEEVRGEFAVVHRQTELQNLTADFDLLRRISANSGGTFYNVAQLDKLQADLRKTEATSVIHTEESFESLVNLKWVFFVLLVLVTVEWFSRRYWGSY